MTLPELVVVNYHNTDEDQFDNLLHHLAESGVPFLKLMRDQMNLIVARKSQKKKNQHL